MSVGRVIGYLVVFLMVPALIVVLSVGFTEAGKPAKELDCANGIDDDNDGKVDCLDPDCRKDAACSGDCEPTEDPEFSCSDGVDNDCDGLTDNFDPDCPNAPKCANSFSAWFRDTEPIGNPGELGYTPGDGVKSDDGRVYEDNVDKVMIVSFRFDTYTSRWNPNKTPPRKVRFDLSQFDKLGDCVPYGWGPGETAGPIVAVNVVFDNYYGGLDLCTLLAESESGRRDCSVGPGGTCWLPGNAQYDPALQSQAMVSLHMYFDNQDLSGRTLAFGGMRDSEGDWNPCGDRVVVTRVTENEWTIEGVNACLIGEGYSFVPVEQSPGEFSRPAPFQLTITEIP
jgi:hypothetical protein